MNRTLRNIVLALVTLSWTSAALGADVGANYSQGPGGYFRKDDRSGPYAIDSTGNATLIGSGVSSGGGGGTAGGSVTPGGTAGTTAQAVQGIPNGVPQNVTVTNGQAPGSMEQDVRSSGTLAAGTVNSAIVIPVNGQSTVGMTFSGLTASGATVTYEQSNDGGTTYTGVNEVNAGTGVPSATRTTDGQTRVAVQGRTNLRLRVSTAGTGTISVAWNVSVREGLVTLASPLPPGTNAVGTFGLNGPIPTGSNVIGAVTQSGGPWSVSGAVSVNNFPATQPVSGTVAVSNFPATQPVSGTVTLGAGSAAVGSVSVSNFPASTAVTDATVAIPLSATGTTTGFRVDGYGSLFIDIASLNVTLTVQGSSDSTNGTDGTWTSLLGASADDITTNPATAVSTAVKRRIYRIQDTGGWVRLNVTAITGSGSVYLTKRLAPLGERAVMIGGGTSNSVPITSSNTGGIVVTSGISRLVSSAASTNATVAKSSGGRLYKVFACNTTTTAAYIKFYNVSTAPTVGTTAVVLSRPLPPAAAAGGLACASYDMMDFGWFFSTGIAYAFTTGSADSDTTALAAGQVVQSSVEFQ